MSDGPVHDSRATDGARAIASGTVETVLGPIEPGTLGWVLPHEHTAIALWHIPNRWDYWELRRDEPLIADELGAFRTAGGGAVVDLTLDGVGRDPEWLARIAAATGLHIVMGSGWYRGAYYPADALIDRRSVDALADVIVRDATVGVGTTGVRSGIIGEIGTDKPWISALEERVHRAAARAARRTGLAITTHAVQSTVGLDQLDVFAAEGADLTRVVIGHADSHPSLDYHLAIVDRGATVEFDFLGMAFTPLERHGEGRLVELVQALVARGHAERILLSQDVCHDGQLRRYGGNGYTYLAETFLPRLRDAGLSEADLATITVDNPRRLLTIAPPAG
ncbi:MAG: phosphotriesterase-related protein [Chloroflexota bacterium]|nr:phosphotriesterase-related protein [Chloroflexota bacterium]